MTISIWGRYQNRQPEKIDQANNRKEAFYLAGEYRMAFGPSWTIWPGRKSDEPPDPNRHNCYERRY